MSLLKKRKKKRVIELKDRMLNMNTNKKENKRERTENDHHALKVY